MRLHGRDPVTGGGRRLQRAVDRLGIPPEPAVPPPAPVVTEADLAGLPSSAQRLLGWAQVLGRPRDRSFRVRWDGEFRLRPEQPFLRCSAWQYDRVDPIARAFAMRLGLAGGALPVLGSDTYSYGQGAMRGRLLGLVPVADGVGPEFDLGELVTWLGEVCLLAPSMLLDPAVTFSAVDDTSVDVTVTDAGLTATGRVLLDAEGAPTGFTTGDRWADLPTGLVRTRWSTPVQGWVRHRDRWVPRDSSAVWHLPDGPYVYARGRFVPETLRYDVPLRQAAG